MNKKGFAITGMFIILILAVISLLAFFISSTIRWILIGIGLFIFAGYLITTIKNWKIKLISSIFIILVGMFFIFGSGYIQQSILSLSQVNVGEDGKVYWTWYASANKPGETYLFTYNPSKFTKSDGTQIIPQRNLILTISPSQPECVYHLTKIVKRSLFNNIEYYVLDNPEKRINVEIYDRDAQRAILDGTTVSSVIINDKDGKGKVIVETQGLLGGKFNCPSQSNVALVYDKESNKYNFFYKNELDNYINNYETSLWGLVKLWYSKSNLRLNSEFTSNIQGEPTFNLNNNVLKLNIPFGYPTFTITADQDYFDSTTYIPPPIIEPKIVDIKYQDNVEVGKSTTIKVIIKNKENDKGLAIIKASSTIGDISPTSTNVDIDNNKKEVMFNFNSPSNINCGKIKFTVCGINQFEESNCDYESISICTTKEAVEEKCGDNICQDYEDYSTCPEDCKSPNPIPIPNDNKTVMCSWYQEPYTKQTKDYGFMYWRVLINKPIVTEVNGCRTAGWVYLTGGGFIMISLGIFAIMLFKQPKIKRRKKK